MSVAYIIFYLLATTAYIHIILSLISGTSENIILIIVSFN